MPRSRRAWLIAATTAMLLSAVSPAAGAPALPVISADHWELENPVEAAAWSRKSPFWEVWNQAAGAAYAKKGKRNVIEAVSICQPPRAYHQAAAKLVYRWKSGYHGQTAIRILGVINGQIISYPGFAGSGWGEAKVTLEVRNATKGEVIVSETLYKEESPEMIKDVLAKQKDLENRADSEDTEANWYPFHMDEGHDYEATVKLWTECSTFGFYGVRTDFSRHTLSTPEDPLIGYVRVDKVTFDFKGARGGSGL